MRYWQIMMLGAIVIWLAGCAPRANTSPMMTVVPTIALTLVSTPTPAPSNPPPPSDIAATDAESPDSGSTTTVPAPTAEFTNPAPTHTVPPFAPTPTFDPAAWTTLPVIPTLSPRALAVLQNGLAKGNNPHAFAKIGDCESRASWFLGDFDLGTKYYSLGEYQNALSPVITYYAGSFKRVSLAARPGFTAASLMAPIWSDKQTCQKNENPLACEYRVQRPIVAFIMLGSNDASNPKTFEGHMRKIIEFSIQQGVLPVLGTKADNVEKDQFINQTIARLAYEYGLPLWNFWSAVQDLPDHGLQPDGVHLTFGTSRFDDPATMKKAWPVRNLNALEILKTVMDQTK